MLHAFGFEHSNLFYYLYDLLIMTNMVTKNITFSYTEYENVEELPAQERELVESARKIAATAYAPYSRFRVGAAVRLESGRIVSGSNVENAAFPSGICAERSALSNSVSNYPEDKPVALAIAAMNEKGLTNDYPSPCGSCRQVIAEEESRTGKKIRMILSGKNKIIVIEGIDSLLPLQFNRSNLDF
jgi:cytidine deaminase